MKTEIGALGPVGDYLTEEIAYEWQRKSSFDMKAFAVITANLGLVTIFVAISSRAGFFHNYSTGPHHRLADGSLVFLTCSLVTSIITAIPLSYGAPSLNGIRSISARINQFSDAADAYQEILEVKVKQLESARRSNSIKAAASLVSFLLLVGAVALFSIGAVTST